MEMNGNLRERPVRPAPKGSPRPMALTLPVCLLGASVFLGFISGTVGLRLPGVALASSFGADPGGSGGDTLLPQGFPPQEALDAIEQGATAGTVAHAVSLRPTDALLGPAVWAQEGGGETRNPFFSPQVPASPGGSAATNASGLPIGEGRAKRSPAWIRHFGGGGLDRMNFRFFRQPVVVGGRVIVTSTRGVVLCLDAVTGRTLWESRLPESVYAPAVADRTTVYLAGGMPWVTAPHMLGYAQSRTIRRGRRTGRLYALSLLSGKLLWSAPVPGPVLGSPVLAGGMVWLTTGAGHLAGYGIEQERKTLDMPLSSSSGWSSPLFVHHWLWLSLEGPTKLLALWPEKKRTVWALSAPPEQRLVLFTPTPSFGDRRLLTLFREMDGGVPVEHLSIVSAVTGNIFHEVAFSGVPRIPSSGLPPYARVYEGMAGVTVSGQTAVAASALFRQAMAVDIPSGHRFWRRSLPSRPYGSGTMVGGLYILPLVGEVLLLDLATGKEAGRIPFDGAPGSGSPPVVGKTLYLSGRNGQVAAISLTPYGRFIAPPASGRVGKTEMTGNAHPPAAPGTEEDDGE